MRVRIDYTLNSVLFFLNEEERAAAFDVVDVNSQQINKMSLKKLVSIPKEAAADDICKMCLENLKAEESVLEFHVVIDIFINHVFYNVKPMIIDAQIEG